MTNRRRGRETKRCKWKRREGANGIRSGKKWMKEKRKQIVRLEQVWIFVWARRGEQVSDRYKFLCFNSRIVEGGCEKSCRSGELLLLSGRCAESFIRDVRVPFFLSFRSVRSVKRSLSVSVLHRVFLFCVTVDHCQSSSRICIRDYEWPLALCARL